MQQCEEKKWGEIETKSFGGKSFSETKSTNRSQGGAGVVKDLAGRNQTSKSHMSSMN